MTKVINTVIKLRRDNDYNYQKVGQKFVPAFGEVCFVDTARSGLRAVVGDGVTVFDNLEFADDIFVKAYYNKADSKFYKGADFTEEVIGNTNRIYIDLNNINNIYYYNGEEYVMIGAGEIPTASTEVPGVMKLYNTIGNNIDGTMTQKAITDELSQKLEASVDGETIVFS